MGASLNTMTESLLDASKRHELEEEIVRREQYFRSLIEKSADVVMVLNDDSTIRYISPSVGRAIGIGPENLIGSSAFSGIVHPKDLKSCLDAFRSVAEDSQATEFLAVRVRHANGSWRAFEGTLRNLRDDAAVAGYVLNCRDVTEREHAEAALRESERLLLESQSVAQIGSYVLDIPAGVWESSPVLDHIFGIREDHERSVESWLALVHPDVRQSMADYFAHEVLEQCARFNKEYRIVRHDDGAERWVLGLGELEFDASGRPLRMIGTIQDITERKQAEEALARASRQNELILNSAVEGIYGLDLDGNTTFINPAAAEMIGWESGDLIGKRQHDILHHSRADGSPYPREECPIYAAFKDGTTQHVESEVFWRKDGTSFPVEYASTPIFDEQGELAGAVVSFSDITERREAEETIRHLAYHDGPTNLPNRALFQDRLDIALAQARRRERLLAVLYVDLDRFKSVNDSAGHDAGDTVLRIAAERLSAIVRDGDSAARVGGDEFTLLLSEIAGEEDAVAVAQRVLEAFRASFVVDNRNFYVTASIGIALFPSDGEDAESLLRSSDEAMYRVKDNGGNNYLLCTKDMNVGISKRLAVEADLRSGLMRGEFVVHYQPQVDIDTGQIVGTEGLVRWQHPELGLTLPTDFIPVAEATGLIVPLGHWVLRAACAQNAAWQEAGLPPMRIAVNLSARQFQQRNLLDMVSGALQEARLDPRHLQLEITEGVAMQDAELATSVLTDLRKIGVQIAIDDFGIGYSSLDYLKRFPINALKIDRSFVRDVTTDPHDSAIASTIIAMAHALKLNVIAEGVETDEQLTFLRERRCNEFQGYHCSRPIPADKLEELLRQSAFAAASPGTEMF